MNNIQYAMNYELVDLIAVRERFGVTFVDIITMLIVCRRGASCPLFYG